jgi:hypothetical protein
MLTHRLVQALLLAVTATVALPGSVSFVQAAEECRSKPGPTASSGSRWLYQINRTDHRHCWFLSSKAVSTQSQSSRRYRHLAGESDAVRQDQQGGSDLKARSAPASETDVAEAAEPPTAPQIAAPSVGLSSENLVAHSVPSIVYRLPPPSAQPVSRPTAVAARTAHTVEVQPAGASKTNVVLLAGAAVLGLLFAAVAFHVTRHVHLRSRTRAIADQQGVRGPVAVRSSVATKPSSMMTDLPEGRKTSLRELGHHLKPTLEACNSPSSQHGSFPTRCRTDDASGAISLPPAAAWLTRPKAKLRVEQAICALADA